MIIFDIIESPDTNVINHFEFHGNTLYIGKKSADLTISDNDLKDNHVMIEVIGNDLILHPQNLVEYFLLNGKRATSVRKIKKTDLITIGKTTIKIIGFDETITKSKKEILNQKLETLVNKNSKVLPIIEKLSNMSK